MHRRSNRNIEIVRGDSYELWVGLAQGFDGITGEPAAYEGRLVLRDRQDDLMPETMAMASELITGEDSRFPDMTHLLHFTATPAETQALPDWPLVCFCEVRAKDLSWVRRLFDGKVTIRD